MRMAVAAQKAFKAQHVAVFRLAKNDRAAHSGLQDGHATQDQGAHDALAKFGFCDHQRPQLLRWDDECLYRLLRDRVHQGRAVRQLGQFAQEVPWPMDANRFFVVELVAPYDCDAASEYDHEAGGDLAGGPEPLTAGKRAHLAKLTHPLDFRRIEDGIYLIAPLFANGLQLQRHRGPPHTNGFNDFGHLTRSRVAGEVSNPALEVLARARKHTIVDRGLGENLRQFSLRSDRPYLLCFRRSAYVFP